MRHTKKDTTDTKSTHTNSNKLLKDLKALLDEAEKFLADSVVDPLEDDAHNLGERFGAATQKVSEVYDDAKNQTVETAKNTNAYIHHNPYPSIAIAVVTGLLTGLLIGRHGPVDNHRS